MIKNFKNASIRTGQKRGKFWDQTSNLLITNGLVLHLDAGNTASYPGTGTSWTDLSGSGNNGTLLNGVGYNSTDKSLIFDGVNDQVSIANSSTYNNTNSKTLEMWVNAGNVGANYIMLGINRSTGDQDTNMQLGIDNRRVIRSWNPNGTDYMVLLFTVGNGTISFPTFSKEKLGTTTGDNLWHQIAAVTNVSQSSISLYYDGSLVHSASISGTLATPNTNFRIGSGYTAGQTDYPFTGKIGMVRMYNRALSLDEINNNFLYGSKRYES